MKFLRFFFLMILVYSCSKERDDNEFLSSNKTLYSFSIKELPNVVFTGISKGTLTATLDVEANLNELTAVYEVSKGATVELNGVVQKSGVTTNDFSETVGYTIVAEDKSKADFTVTILPYTNKNPIANAGADEILYVGANTGEIEVTLNASASTDPENQSLLYNWALADGSNFESEVVQVSLGLGVHEIMLTVTDTKGATHTDNIRIEIRELGTYAPINTNATQQTKNVLTNLARLAKGSRFAFGQEHPLSFKLGEISYDLNTSDCKDVTGDHPGVFGIDPHYMLYKGADERELHINEARRAYENGSIVTLDFHQTSRTDGQIYYDEITSTTDKSLMYDIVYNKNGAREWYFDEMDRVIDILNNQLGFTVVFRPLHEMNGGWFWWGTRTKNHSPQLYVELYRMTVDYINERSNHVLFAWSPNFPFNDEYYPGDAYVDIVGIDYYNPDKAILKQVLIDLTLFANEHHKIAAFTETGQQNYVYDNPNFYTDTILAVIEEGGSDINIAWVLSWFNAPWDNSQANLFIPNAESTDNVKNDFIAFKQSNTTLFQEDMSLLNLYEVDYSN